MNSIDLSPLYRSTIGFDRLGTLLDSALRAENTASYPPYNIEVTGENRYAITLAVAGFELSELDIQVERGLLSVRGKKLDDSPNGRKFLYQGIAARSFERKFNLADHVEVTGAQLNNGLLAIQLVKQIPEAMKPKTISISNVQRVNSNSFVEHKQEETQAA
ncbi:MAG: Hsp20 family protein [Chitinophagaceae bacterium]|nr:MAG: Hsp20 family protein [Chitinophagaceae bacterium]